MPEGQAQAAQAAIAAITQLSALIQDMATRVAETNRAASGGPGIEGLAQTAERLHTDTGRLADTAPVSSARPSTSRTGARRGRR